jgi:hypothetical protein
MFELSLELAGRQVALGGKVCYADLTMSGAQTGHHAGVAQTDVPPGRLMLML